MKEWSCLNLYEVKLVSQNTVQAKDALSGKKKADTEANTWGYTRTLLGLDWEQSKIQFILLD